MDLLYNYLQKNWENYKLLNSYGNKIKMIVALTIPLLLAKYQYVSYNLYHSI